MELTQISSRPSYRPGLRDLAERALARRLFGLSAGMKVRLSGGTPLELDGLTLHPDLQLMLRARKLSSSGGQGLSAETPEQARNLLRREALLYQGPEFPVGAVQQLQVAGHDGQLQARHYAPPEAAGTTNGAKPLCLFFHGGGFVIGDLDTHDATCRALCHHADVHVLSVDYRLAPEHPFPAAPQDAVRAFAFAVEHAAELGADPARVGVAGDSAGGNLSAVVAQQTRSTRPPDFALLLYPAVDRAAPYPSKTLFAEGLFLTANDMAFFDQMYFGADDATRKDPLLSPMYGDLAGLCPTTLVTAGFDPLRDEGEAYARAMQAAGNKVTLRREKGLVHGYANMHGVSRACHAALLSAAADLRTLAHGGT